MVAAVYVVGGPGDREDLRYSLRSLTNAPCIDEVWVVGDVPGWFRGVKLPLEPQPEKFANQRQSITRFVNTPGAPQRFYLFNDDMFITEPVAAALPTCRNLTPLSVWAKVHRDALLFAGPHPWDCWQCSIIDTAEWTAEQTGSDPWLYECHTPLLFDTARLRDVLAVYPPDRRFVAGEVYPIAGAGGEGESCGNAKCKTAASFAKKLTNPMPYLSCSPDTWTRPVGPHVRSLFVEPSRYEEVRI